MGEANSAVCILVSSHPCELPSSQFKLKCLSHLAVIGISLQCTYNVETSVKPLPYSHPLCQSIPASFQGPYPQGGLPPVLLAIRQNVKVTLPSNMRPD